MNIQHLKPTETHFQLDIAELLENTWPNSYKGRGREKVNSFLEQDRIALIAVENNHVIGFIGAIPQYGITGWELHPLIVRADKQHNGIGSLLLSKLELEVAQKGGITLYLGSDDTEHKTTLANTDLYENTFEKINNIQNRYHHPYEFYQKRGYHIVGVIPDANGLGKPDIWMAKRIKL